MSLAFVRLSRAQRLELVPRALRASSHGCGVVDYLVPRCTHSGIPSRVYRGSALAVVRALSYIISLSLFEQHARVVALRLAAAGLHHK